MIYVTVRQNVKEKQISWLDIINETAEMKLGTEGTPGTITRCYETIPDKLLETIDVDNMVNTLKIFNEAHKNLFERDRKSMYRRFYQPKKKGGLRPIDQPCDELQLALAELRYILEERFGVLHHTAAFAYVKHRSTTQVAHKHQANKSNWFLSTDFSGFFPNTNLPFTMKMLKMIFPLSEICKREDGYKELEKAISLAFLNGGLPQGTKVSPTLTNIVMIPIDHRIFNDLNKKRFVYTRYADDIQISCVQKFDHNKMVKYMEGVLREFGAPWEIKPDKTHFGTNKACTANWMLGVNLNKDNNITVGWKAKNDFKIMTHHLIMDYKNNERWQMEDLQYYRGILSYYQMVEKEYFATMLDRYYKKYCVSVKKILKEWMGSGEKKTRRKTHVVHDVVNNGTVHIDAERIAWEDTPF